MASLFKRLVRLVTIADDVRSVVRSLKLLRKLIRGLRGRPGSLA
ncbi:hypothetical protein [Halorussus lipolyticus]|nr:hypothetical protein [Halorussus sp. DT80]